MMQTLRRVDASLGSIFEDGAKIMFSIFLAAALLACIRYERVAVRHPYSLDYGEAPLVDQAMRLAAGQNIYRTDLSTPPYTISNYPPVYVSLVAVGVRLFGPAGAFIFGRTISVLSAWAAAIFLMLIVYSQTRDHIAALGGGLIFLAFPFVVAWSPLLRIDMLALALSLGGMCLLAVASAEGKRLTPWRLVGVALLLTAAIYTRQSYGLAAPLASFVWLLARDWRQALRLALLVGGLGLTLFLILNTLTRGGFFFNIVTANVNEFKMEQLEYYATRLREIVPILLCVGGASFFLIPRWNPLWTLSAPYLVGAALSAATIGKIGSNVNYLLELSAALSLAAGAALAWSRAHLSWHTLRAAVLILLALGVGNLLHAMFQDYIWDLLDRRAARTELFRLESLVQKTEGAILADEYMGMLTLQGRPLHLQPFEVTQLARAGKWDQTPLLESIKNREFAVILLFDRPWVQERWTPEMLDAITEAYILADSLAENLVYKPYVRVVTKTNVEICPGTSWRLPTDGSLGVQWKDHIVDFFGQGKEGSIPVYAVADGFLTRETDWVDAVAILHEDPLRPGSRVWSVYAGMAAANGKDSFIVEDFPAGSRGFPVKSGQLLGYQGSWSGTPLWPTWVHTFFAVTKATQSEIFPKNITLPNILDPVPYLGLSLEAGNENPQPLKCKGP
jgi:hypothetical protein